MPAPAGPWVASSVVRIPPADTPKRPPKKKKRVSNKGRIALLIMAAAVFVLFLSARGIAGFYTDYLWFDAQGHTEVFRNILLAKIALAIIFSLLFAVLLAINLIIADRVAPKQRVPGPDEQLLDRYQQLVGRRRYLLYILISLVFGLVAGLPVSNQWNDWLLFTHAVDFGVSDAQFGTDVGFYVFRLPFLTFVVDWLFAAMVIVLIVTTIAHYLNGGIRLQVQGQRVTPQVKLHLSVLLAFLALLKAADYWLAQYQLTTSTQGFVDGALYTAVRAQLPAIRLLAVISILAAVLLVLNTRQRGWRLPIIAVGLWALVALVAGTIYPAFVQRFVVDPNESEREREYIGRNIEATRAAMSLSDVVEEEYPVGTLQPAELEANIDSLRNVRLVDPQLQIDTFQRLEGLRSYYRFNELDVDRYVGPDGEPTQVVVGVRELNSGDLPSDSWENRHLAYTHGYGVAVAPASRIQSNGQPAFLDVLARAGVVPQLERPQVYFGERLDSYAVVNTNRDEISYGGGATDTTVRYEGTGGVRLSSRLRRAAFAIRFGEWNLFGSGLITENSRILYERDVRDRVKLLAPFLRFDSDPYPVVRNGHLVWIVDAYTTSPHYPYAQRANTEQLPAGHGLGGRFNYLRNSVKATVDAYDGNVTFYVVDETDPVAQAWAKAFPDLFEPASAVPDDLRSHFRYPEDMFRVQTNMYSRYHIEAPSAFYQNEDAWNVAQNAPKSQSDRAAAATGQGSITVTGVTRAKEDRIPPYYALVRLPGAEEVQFVLVRSFVPFSEQDTRKELQAFMTASSDPDDYGTLRVFRIENPGPIDGPSLVDTNIKQTFAAELTLLDQQGSQVTFGDLQLLPIGDSILYVRPWYVQATSRTPVPELRYVTVTYDKESYRGTSLEEALAQAFDVELDLDTVVRVPGSDAGEPGGSTTTTTATPGTTVPPTTVPGAVSSVEELLAEAQALYEEAQSALRDGDLGTYQEKLEQAYEKAAQAAALATGGPVSVGSTTTVPPNPGTPVTTSVPAIGNQPPGVTTTASA